MASFMGLFIYVIAIGVAWFYPFKIRSQLADFICISRDWIVGVRRGIALFRWRNYCIINAFVIVSRIGFFVVRRLIVIDMKWFVGGSHAFLLGVLIRLS